MTDFWSSPSRMEFTGLHAPCCVGMHMSSKANEVSHACLLCCAACVTPSGGCLLPSTTVPPGLPSCQVTNTPDCRDVNADCITDGSIAAATACTSTSIGAVVATGTCSATNGGQCGARPLLTLPSASEEPCPLQVVVHPKIQHRSCMQCSLRNAVLMLELWLI